MKARYRGRPADELSETRVTKNIITFRRLTLETFENYIAQVETDEGRARAIEILQWIGETFPELDKRIAWNAPHFTDHGTFIIGLSTAKKHTAMSLETAGITPFIDELKENGYQPSKMLFRIGFQQDVNYDLLKRMIQFTIDDKKECKTYWRK